MRVELEEAAQFAVDTAGRLTALLDGMDEDADDKLNGDDEPSLGAPEGH